MGEGRRKNLGGLRSEVTQVHRPLYLHTLALFAQPTDSRRISVSVSRFMKIRRRSIATLFRFITPHQPLIILVYKNQRRYCHSTVYTFISLYSATISVTLASNSRCISFSLFHPPYCHNLSIISFQFQVHQLLIYLVYKITLRTATVYTFISLYSVTI